MKTVAFVPIKMNSQRVPHKNTRSLGGKPMCSYVFNALLDVNGIDEVCVFCSDESITKYLPDGVKFVQRNSELDRDEVKGQQIYQSFIADVDADVYVLVHTTSPFLKSSTIQKALDEVKMAHADSAFTAKRIQTFAWYKGAPLNYKLTDVPRTQDIEPVWYETSGFYIFSKSLMKDEGRRIGDRPFIAEVDSIEAVDIDEPEDFEYAELIAGVI